MLFFIQMTCTYKSAAAITEEALLVFNAAFISHAHPAALLTFISNSSCGRAILPSRHKDVLKTSYFWSQRRPRLVWNESRDDLFSRRRQDVFQETSARRFPGNVLKTSFRKCPQDVFQETPSRRLPGHVLKMSSTRRPKDLLRTS